jgi:DMSO reductase anchor subunit
MLGKDQMDAASLERSYTLPFRLRTALILGAVLAWLVLVPLQLTLFLMMCLAGIGLLAAIAVEILYPPSEEELAQHIPLNLDERKRW